MPTKPGPPSRTRPLPPGSLAPDFLLPCSPEERLSLSALRGNPVILVFYAADWSRVCGDELALFNEARPEFARRGAVLLGISVDGTWCHAEYARQHRLDFPLLSDFEPKGEVARSYGVYRAAGGVADRALFVIDGVGIIHWRQVAPIGVNPGAGAVLEALDQLPGGAGAHP